MLRSLVWLVLMGVLAPVAWGAPSVVIVVGAEGAEEYGRAFSEWAERWVKAAEKASANVTQIGRDGVTGGEGSSGGDRERLRNVLNVEAKETHDALWVVLIGHGTFDGKEAKFNLRGPDVTDGELAEWLRAAKRPVAVINCASASGPFLGRLSGPDRVVITATRSGNENNFARFGEYLSASIGDPAADLDKDGQTSLLEAFLSASHRTGEFYKQGARLATEHPLLDDNGDKLGVSADWFQGTRATRSAKDGAPIDGLKAHQWHLLLSAGERAMPAEVRAKRDALELEIEKLRGRKKGMKEEEYYAQLEPLILQLARLYGEGGNAEPGTRAAP